MDSRVLKTLEFDKIVKKLAECTTSVLGKELVEKLLPSNQYAEVEKRICATAEGKVLLDHAMLVPFGAIRDIREFLKKSKIGAILEPYELLDIASTLYAMRKVKRFFKEIEIEVPILQTLSSTIEIVGNLENQIECVIDEHGAVRENASVELQRIRREIKQTQNHIKERLDSVLRASEYQKYFQDILVTMRGDRYVVPIKQEYRQFFPGVVHDQSASGATLFIEPMAIVNLNNDVKQLIIAEKHELARILKAITLQIVKYADVLNENCEVLAKIDFILAKAKLSQQMDAVKPILNNDGYVDLYEARHPLIESDKVVPININLGKDFRTLLITGPNTGGKTVSIKTLGLFALMVQAGLFIPALENSEITVFNNIYADIGDEQSIEQSLSTFSAHMTHLVNILSKVTKDDLLLIDEIGAGTDPEEGAALAMAILEHLVDLGTKVVATTHYSELKTFAYSKEHIQNASVEFDIATLKPTYRLLLGIPGTSNAFAISKRLGLAENLIYRAKQLIDEDHAKFEHVLNHLESEKIMYENRNLDMVKREQEVKDLETRVQLMRDELMMKKDRIIQKAQEESASLIRRTRRETEQIIATLKEQFNDQGIKKRQEAIDHTRNNLKNRLNAVDVEDKKNSYTTPITLDKLALGDRVYVTTLDQKGIVASILGNDIVVQLGIMKVTVPISVCRAVGEEKVKPKQKTASIKFSRVNEVNRQIDIRGMMVDEAEEVVGKYLDNAILAGLNQVLVIHGKGTGALRKGIRSYLKGHRCVQEIGIGDVHEGGDGVTIVKFK